MFKYTHFYLILAFIFGTILFFTHNALSDSVLDATIQGENSGPKKYIRVEISGPEFKKLSTNSSGKILTSLQPGNYTILIKERGRHMKFKLTVKNDAVTTKTFVLAW